mmetsp:Transcript_20893/g.15341  ORF Transcript_20893/g.15341 Transcript_20893/m.15341 type:complete len:107 (+) Transcript_20893:39-359(+)
MVVKHLTSYDVGKNFTSIQPEPEQEYYGRRPNNLWEGKFQEHFPWDFDEEKKYQKDAYLQLRRQDKDVEIGFLRPEMEDYHELERNNEELSQKLSKAEKELSQKTA